MSLIFTPYALVLGFNEFAVDTLEFSFFLADLIILYLISLRRLGPWFALVPLVFLTLDPVLYLNMSEGRSVSVLILFVLVTLWAIWKGLENSSWLWVAGIGASLGFLTADTVGYLFVAAGLVGLFCVSTMFGGGFSRTEGTSGFDHLPRDTCFLDGL